MKEIFKHELKMYYTSIVPYIFGAFLLCFIGVGALLYNINSAVANFEYVLAFISVIFVVIIPILTMKTISQERHQRTDQMLYSAPVTSIDIILGKYFALLMVFVISIFPTLFYPLIFKFFGNVYLPTSYGSFVAFFLMGAALIAIGIFVSSLTENMGIAAGISLVIILVNYYSTSLADYYPETGLASVIGVVVVILLLSWLIRWMTGNENLSLSFLLLGVFAVCISYSIKPELYEGLMGKMLNDFDLFERFVTFVNGIFDLKTIIFYLSVSVVFLLLSVESMEKRRYC